jgi:DNA primase
MSLRYERWARKNLDVVLDGSPNGEWYARCPFTSKHKHGDKNPSFGINVKRGLFYCHGCQERGTFAQLAEKLRVGLDEDPPSIGDIEDLVDVLLANERAAPDEVKRYPESWLNQFRGRSELRKISDYWIKQRGISPQVVDEWKLGFDTLTNSATIPLRDLHGHPLGVIRRRMARNAKPRYMYPKGFKISEHLWGAHACNGEQTIAVVEGSVDALALWSVGIPAVALLGSRISDHQVTLLNRIGPSEIVTMTDRDPAGREASRRIQQAVNGSIVSIGRYRKSWEGKDPAALTEEQRITMFECADVFR